VKISIGTYCSPYGVYSYTPTILLPIDYKFTELEFLAADKIVVFDDSEKVSFEWNKVYPKNVNREFNLSFVKVVSHKMVSPRLIVVVDKVLPTTCKILDKITPIVLFANKIDSIDQSSFKYLKNEIIKVIWDVSRQKNL